MQSDEQRKKGLGIYIHFPFCVKKCDYCDFLSFPVGRDSLLGSGAFAEAYVDALLREIEKEAPFYLDHQIETVFFGGGTPSLLSAGQIGQVLSLLRDRFAWGSDPEITMEMNPGTVREDDLYGYREMGVGRVSIGLQAIQDSLLRTLGRIHTYADFLKTWDLIEKVGFNSRNIDLMSSLPGQTVQDYRESLKEVVSLGVEHISAYSLIIEEGTPFYARYQENKDPLPDEEADREMYDITRQDLEEAGFHRYEISNYAREGYECRHNLTYWTGGDYAGFGLGASSMVGHTRWKNTSDMKIYLQDAGEAGKSIQCERSALSISEQQEEFMILGLRLMKGVSKEEFFLRFSMEMDELYGKELKKHEKEGLLVNGPTVYLTKRGIDVSNYVLADFIQG